MSDQEHFLARWSQRKRAAQEAEAKTSPAAPAADATHADAVEPERKDAAAAAASSDAPRPPEPPFDPASLPPIESISAETDIRAFLAPGVPPELTLAALRRVWAADPKIRDFVGLADYDWDFNTPGAITGFGTLEMTDELRREIARMVGRGLSPEPSARPEPTLADASTRQVTVGSPDVATTAGPPTPEAGSHRELPQDEPSKNQGEVHNTSPAPQRREEHVAAQNSGEGPDNDQPIVKRPHGRALPR
jgi:Protein of unknown function (DUF3306)